jgi:hypothetical protein
MATRRNVLTLLGVASASSAAIATDDLAPLNPGPGPGLRLGGDTNRIATALERLAAELRAGTVWVSRFHVGSEMAAHNLLTQTVSIDLLLQHEEGA